MSTESQAPIVIYQEADQRVEVRLDAEHETVWLTQAQMAELFDVRPQNITMHLKNVYADGELVEEVTCKDFLQVQQDFVVKNHPFADGNKRSAAYLFVDFLYRNDRLLDAHGEVVVNDVGLAALTLLIAESDPANKETMVRLIMNMLASPGDA